VTLKELEMLTTIMTTGHAPSQPAMPRTDEGCWDAVRRRDKASDGGFFYSVRTTGVFCRPSCAARLPRRENVAFHATVADAERAGFRPCKRCRPDEAPQSERRAAIVTRACRVIEQAEEPPTLDELASAAGLSRFHFHRLFKAQTGVTPKAYAQAHRAGRVRDSLAEGASVTSSIYAAGFNSSGRFYASSSERLGMTPSQFRGGGTGASMRFALGECSLGSILVAASDQGVAAIQFGDDPGALLRGLQDRFPKARLVGGDEDFERLVAIVVGLVERPTDTELPLDVRGTAFQQRVWQALREIPRGSTASYAEIAARIGQPAAVRAVARACAANGIAVAIPCHRVVRTNGSLGGYRWGVERKQALLEREAAS
jgi:AraC family transcriptional regulator, regulatory protein of adaptative response / methylated-DNA-[protein]-cysteine methyltransferase